MNGSSQCIFIHHGPLFPEFLKIKTTLLRYVVHMTVTMYVTILWHVTCSLVHNLGDKIVLDFYFELVVSSLFFFKVRMRTSLNTGCG